MARPSLARCATSLVSDTDLRDWQRVVDCIRTLPEAGSLTLGAEPAALPTSGEDVFALRERALTSLGIDVAGVAVSVHFFDRTEIGLDFDPRDVTTEDRRATLIALVRALADLLDQPVVVAPEGSYDEVLLRVEPISQDIA